MNVKAAGYFTALALMLGGPMVFMSAPALRSTYNQVAHKNVAVEEPAVSRENCLAGGSLLLAGDLLALGTLAASRKKKPAGLAVS